MLGLPDEELAPVSMGTYQRARLFWRRSSPSALDPKGGRGRDQTLAEYIVAEIR